MKHDRWGLVADDLTGACIVGGALANAGVAAAIATGARPVAPADLAAGVDVPAVNADSRVVPAAEAARRVAAASALVRAAGCTRIYKFVDSTLRGHLGVELEAALDGATGSGRRALIVPGTPAAGRTVEGGRLLCLGVPAHRSPLANRDPLSPIATDRVTELFSRDASREYVSLGERIGPSPDPTRLAHTLDGVWRSGGVPICDAPSDAAIHALVATLERSGHLDTIDVLCGSVGLARAWAATLARASARGRAPRDPTTPPPTREPPGPPPLVLVVSGSRSAPTLEQLARLEGAGTRSVAVWDARQGRLRPDAVVDAAIDAALLHDGAAALVVGAPRSVTASPEGDEDDDRRRAAMLTESLARATGGVVARAADAGRVVALVLVGGMTAGAIVGRLGIDILRPRREEGFVVRSDALSSGKTLPVVTKGGSAGDPDALIAAVAALRRA